MNLRSVLSSATWRMAVGSLLVVSTVVVISAGQPASGQATVQANRVALVTATDLDQWCGGTIISSEWVQTAAHCFYDDDSTRFPTSDFRVRLGTPSSATYHRIVGEPVFGDGYEGIADPDDIALIRISPVTPTPAPLSFDLPAIDDDLTMMVWNNNTLLSISMKRSLCPNLEDPNQPRHFLNREMCAANTGGTGTESGDSGTGVFDSDGRLVGVFTGGNDAYESIVPLARHGDLLHSNALIGIVPRNGEDSQVITRRHGGVWTYGNTFVCGDEDYRDKEGFTNIPSAASVTVDADWRDIERTPSSVKARLHSLRIQNHRSEPFRVAGLTAGFTTSGSDLLSPVVLQEMFGSLFLLVPGDGETLLDFSMLDHDDWTATFNDFPSGRPTIEIVLGNDQPLSGNDPSCLYPMSFTYQTIFTIGLPIVTSPIQVQPASLSFDNAGSEQVQISNSLGRQLTVGAIMPDGSGAGVGQSSDPNACDLSRVSTNPTIPPPLNPSVVLAAGESCVVDVLHYGAERFPRVRNIVIAPNGEANTRIPVSIANEHEYLVDTRGEWVAAGLRVDQGFRPGDRIEISAEVATDRLSGQAFVSLNHITNGTKHNVAQRSNSVSGSSGWRRVTTTFVVPQGTTAIEPFLVVTGHGVGRVDGLRVRNLTSGTTLEANGGFENGLSSMPSGYWRWTSGPSFTQAGRAAKS